MAGHKDSFAEKIRRAALLLRDDSFSFADLSSTADLRSSKEETRMRSTVKDFIRRGEMARIAPSEFRYVGRVKDKAETEKRLVMWRLLKMRRLVTVEDLEEMAGASKEYILSWLRSLVGQGVVQKISGPTVTDPCKWRLIKDVDMMPEDEAQKEKYRQIRQQKKEALARVLDRIKAGVDEARGLVEEI